MRYRKTAHPTYRYRVRFDGHDIRGSSIDRTLDRLLAVLYPNAPDYWTRRRLLEVDKGVPAAVSTRMAFRLLHAIPTRLKDSQSSKPASSTLLHIKMRWCNGVVYALNMDEVYENIKGFLYPTSQPTERAFMAHLTALGGLSFDPSVSSDELIRRMMRNGSLIITKGGKGDKV